LHFLSPVVIVPETQQTLSSTKNQNHIYSTQIFFAKSGKKRISALDKEAIDKKSNKEK
jgi:hypothetical protein